MQMPESRIEYPTSSNEYRVIRSPKRVTRNRKRDNCNLRPIPTSFFANKIKI